MKIVTFADKEGSAIDRLAKMNLRRMDHHYMVETCIHPKRPDPKALEQAREFVKTCDLIDFQYWKTAVAIRKLIPECRGKKMVLTHQNEHNIEGDWEWKDFEWDAIVAKNGWQKRKLEAQGYKPVLIKHAVEFENFSYAPELTKEKNVLYVGQIKKVKGVRELKRACDELGYRLIVIGKPSEAEYWEALPKSNMIFYSDLPDKKIGEVYHKARVYCANSDDGTESGTLPILEAMASGIPVVTRNIGHVRDCGAHGKNMFIRKGRYDDVEDLKAALKMVMENDDVANELRENAWRTVRQYHPEIQAREYDKLFRNVMWPDETPVSVIIPTADRHEVVIENLEALKKQSYKNFEVCLIDDSGDPENFVHRSPDPYPFAVRFLSTDKKNPADYGLAKARNIGVIEATGEILVFCDDRLKMHPDAIRNFVRELAKSPNRKVWLWGSKGVFKSFVENFSAIWRRELVNAGMFNERIDRYGGMGQEISARFGSQGFEFRFCAGALAEPTIATHSKSRHREDIIESKVKLYKMGFQ